MGRILVVDDDPDVRTTVSATLREAGHRVFEATDGSEVVDAALTFEPAVVLLDVSMPGMDGYSALKWLKRHPATRAIPVVMLSVLNRIDQRERARVLGAFDYITKPWEDGEVELRTRWALEAAGNPALRVCEHPDLPPVAA